jgi:hypothetical protein
MGNMKPKIESGIPLPERNSYAVLDDLEPGQSVAFPIVDYHTVIRCYSYRQERDGKKFRRKREGTKLRVWRSF